MLFAEGTSSDGNRVLPFRSALVGAVEEAAAAPKAASCIQPMSICYTGQHGIPMGRQHRPLVAWYGDLDFMPHFKTFVARGAVDAVVSFGEPFTADGAADRKAMTKSLEGDVRRLTSATLLFAYLFTHVEPGPESSRYGAFHTSEVPYEFNTLHLSPGRDFTDVDRRLADQFSSYVANFTKTGDPNGRSLPRWPAMTPDNKAIMDLGDRPIASRAIPLGSDAVIAAGRAPAGRGRGGRGNPAGAAVPRPAVAVPFP